VSNETRRLMWTLAHAHGALLGVINVLFGLTLRAAPATEARRPLASKLLVGATILVPSGFFLGGVSFYAGDPGVCIVLLPVGAMLLLAAIFLIARAEWQSPRVLEEKGRKLKNAGRDQSK
jgi:hypothetical protein